LTQLLAHAFLMLQLAFGLNFSTHRIFPELW
jgi:hypothetical protein